MIDGIRVNNVRNVSNVSNVAIELCLLDWSEIALECSRYRGVSWVILLIFVLFESVGVVW